MFERLCIMQFFWYRNFVFQESTHDITSPYYELMKQVGWFFFDLLVLGYVEDPSSGKSFHFPANLSWKLFIEVRHTIWFLCWFGNECVFVVVQVPSRNTAGDPLQNLEQFQKEVPVLDLLGTPVAIKHTSKFSVTGDVQLVCKYLKAFQTKRIDKLYRESRLFSIFITPGNINVKCILCIHFQIVLLWNLVPILNLERKNVKGFSIATCLIILRRIRSLRNYSSSKMFITKLSYQVNSCSVEYSLMIMKTLPW